VSIKPNSKEKKMETMVENRVADVENAKDVAMTLDELVKKVWKEDVILDNGDAVQYIGDENSNRLMEEGIVVVRDGGRITFTRHNPIVRNVVSHKYRMPDFAEQVRSLVRQSIDGNGMVNLICTGAMGTGKTEFVYEIAREFGLKVFQVNGSEGLNMDDFFGTMAVGIDERTQQNYTYFDKGPLYRAFIEGTKVDGNGNQVLDENGDPIVVGKPAVFFLDEFAAMLPEVFLGVFNRAMEIPRQNGKGRSIEIPRDNGRVVKSHPGMVMFLAGNTVGTGNGGRFQMGYTAQGNKMDESTRNRVTGFYKFGYNKEAEKSIALSMLNDDYEAERLMRFRDNARNMFRNEKVETLFTTRSIVATCEVARNFRKNGEGDWMANAICVAVLNGLPETDKPAFNEQVRLIWGVDFMQKESNSNTYDFI
jgi:MoxR-like ATPase